eukprot:6263252-Heterocapsa_arctica.AAC.1
MAPPAQQPTLVVHHVVAASHSVARSHRSNILIMGSDPTYQKPRGRAARSPAIISCKPVRHQSSDREPRSDSPHRTARRRSRRFR